MRSKRIHRPPAAARDDEHPPDATGLTIDWLGVQTTGSGVSEFPWFVVALVALRAVPFLIRRAVLRRRRR